MLSKCAQDKESKQKNFEWELVCGWSASALGMDVVRFGVFCQFISVTLQPKLPAANKESYENPSSTRWSRWAVVPVAGRSGQKHTLRNSVSTAAWSPSLS